VPISDVALCNLALDAAMCRSSISAIGEASAEGQACARHYEQAKEAVLRCTHWNFARKQVNLAVLQDATLTPPDPVPQPWLFEYAYPSDCLLARMVMPQLINPLGTPESAGLNPRLRATRFVVAQDNDPNGNAIPVILSNAPQAQIVYTVRITNPNLFDAMFIETLVLYLGAKLARTLTGNEQRAQSLFQQAAGLEKRAQSMNGDEGLTVIDTMPDWMRVRGFLDDWAQQPGAGFFVDPFPLSLVA
jgi:hypothetical protein